MEEPTEMQSAKCRHGKHYTRNDPSSSINVTRK